MSPVAARRMAVVQPDARIIAILREPASFVRSFRLQCVQAHLETQKDFRKAMALVEARRRGKRIPRHCAEPPFLLYPDHTQYVEQLRRFHDAFPHEQVLVLIYDDFRSDNEGTVRRVQRFLGVDDAHPIRVKEANPSIRIRAPRFYEMVHQVVAGQGAVPRAMRRTVTALTPRNLDRESAVAIRNRFIVANPQPPDESLMVELRGRFKPEVVALSEYLDRDLVTLWGYDSVD